MLDKLLPLFRTTSGCDFHRIVLPIGYAGFDFNIIKTITKEKVQEASVIMYNRLPLNINYQTIESLKKNYGKKIWLDLDDYWELYPHHYLYKTWKKNNTTENIIKNIKIADIITCTTERLASKIKPINPNVTVIPNSLPITKGSGQFEYAPTTCEEVRFGFVGGTSHLHDVRSIGTIFEYFNKLNFKYCGYSSFSKESVMMSDVFSHRGRNPNYSTSAMVPLDRYMYAYNDLDVCIAPLQDNDFNRYKSNLKVLEAGSKKCAVICSSNSCYTDTVPDTVVTYCKSIKDWKEAIRKHKDLDYAKEKGKVLYDWVKGNYDLEIVNEKRIKIIDSLCQ